ncbi:MAG TPA: hypothetical protein VHM70_16915, partial [Polyangiaceae bacterium]|nr:hypothetical protein [Polyangiaceae bacterium]
MHFGFSEHPTSTRVSPETRRACTAAPVGRRVRAAAVAAMACFAFAPLALAETPDTNSPDGPAPETAATAAAARPSVFVHVDTRGLELDPKSVSRALAHELDAEVADDPAHAAARFEVVARAGQTVTVTYL